MSETIIEAVKSKYGAVAASGLSTDHQGVKAVAEAFGYSPEELSSIPAEANMGLSCGNPTATANLRPGETVEPPVTSATSTILIQDGRGQSEIDGRTFNWEKRDSLAVPCFGKVVHTNTSSQEPAFLLQVDDAPLMHKLGYYQEI